MKYPIIFTVGSDKIIYKNKEEVLEDIDDFETLFNMARELNAEPEMTREEILKEIKWLSYQRELKQHILS